MTRAGCRCSTRPSPTSSRELRDPAGGLYSAEDADSEGEEGRYYVWTHEEMTAVLGAELAEARQPPGTASCRGQLRGSDDAAPRRRGDLLRPPESRRRAVQLLASRATRVRPGLDDKIITEWNAMMCSALAEAAAATGRRGLGGGGGPDRHVPARSTCGEPTGGSSARGAGGGRAFSGYAADYAWLVDCLTRLGELTGDPRWTAESVGVARQLLALFADDEGGGLFTNGDDVPPLVVRPRDNYDGVTPAAGSVAAIALARLGALVGDAELEQAADRIVEAAGAAPASAPSAFPELLLGAALLEHGPVEIVVTGDRADLLQAARRRFLPGAVLAWRSPERASIAVDGEAPEPASPLIEGRADGFAYVCRRGACLAPVDNVDDLLAALDDAMGGP